MTKAVSATLISFYLFLLLLGATVQDLPTFFIFGEIGRTGIFILLPFFLFVEILLIVKKKNITLSGKIESYLLFISIWIFFITLVHLLYFLLTSQPIIYYGEHLLVKGAKLSSYWILILLYIRQLNFCVHSLGFERSLKTITRVYLVMVVVLFMEIIFPSILNMLHTNGGENLRGGIRLLTLETSWAGSVFLLLFLLSLWYILKYSITRHRTYLILSASVPAVVFVVCSGSKGLWFCLCLTFLVVFIKNILGKNSKIHKSTLITILILALLLPYGLHVSIESLKADIFNFTSFATRLTTNLAGIKVFLLHPLGVGSAYLWYLPQEIEIVTRELQSFGQLNMQEIHMIVENQQGLVAKSGIINLAMLGGLPVLLAFAFIWITLYKKVKSNALLTFGLVFIFFASLTYIDLSIKYEIWFFIVFLAHGYKEENKYPST